MTTDRSPAVQEICRLLSDMAYYSPGIHSHSCYELYIHVRGDGVFQIGQEKIPVRKLEAFVILPGQLHGFAPGEPLYNYEGLELHLTDDLLRELGWRDFPLKEALESIAALPGQHFSLYQETWRNILPLATGVKDDSPDMHPLERQISFGCLSALLGILCFAGQLGAAPYVTRSTTAQSVLYVSSYLAQNFREDISLDDLAERFNHSKFHLTRRFTKAYGISPHQYLLKCRVNYAKRLILQGEPLSYAASASGFNDYSSFLRAFTRYAGATPSQWKAEFLALPPEP